MTPLDSLGASMRALSLGGAARTSMFSARATTSSPLRPTLSAAALLRRPEGPAQVRYKGQLAPRRTKYRKAHKGRVPVPIGGSIKGTTLNEGAYGLRLLEPARLSAKQIGSAQNALKRKAPVGRVIFEIGGPVDIRPELARDALALAAAKLPVKSEFIDKSSPPRLGSLLQTSIPAESASARGGAGLVTPDQPTPSGVDATSSGTSSTTIAT
ncbi:Mitochondrial ribosomal protein L16 [Ceraceosorus bombacis]|uniref:Mitochondrial ribosomal protein L16 n=1 Tax=Ceraceosorus bombacis TaxID=401625 RepID=A0A0P1BC35_9BASI|nr:Mitochondrial ribosomal protein L16 [Ceraceosorus bombacis]